MWPWKVKNRKNKVHQNSLNGFAKAFINIGTHPNNYNIKKMSNGTKYIWLKQRKWARNCSKINRYQQLWYPSFTQIDTIVIFKARMGWSMSTPWWCPLWRWLSTCSCENGWSTISGCDDSIACIIESRFHFKL